MMKRRIDIGFLIWIFTLIVIVSLTFYRYFQAVNENRQLTGEYKILEMRINDIKKDMEFIRGEADGEVRGNDIPQTQERTGTKSDRTGE